MKRDERQAKLDERLEKYRHFDREIFKVKRIMQTFDDHASRSDASRLMRIAISGMERQIEDDFHRYNKIVNNADSLDEIKQMQAALNRANKKIAELEKEIAEARTSSGLFIKFVREKLGI